MPETGGKWGGARPVKILMLTDRYRHELRSCAALFHDLARALQARGHEVRVITKVPSKYTPPDGGAGRKESKNGWKDVEGVPVRRVRWVPYLGGGRAVRALDHLTLWLAFSFAGREWPEADVVLIYSPPLPLALAGGAYRWRYRAPFVLNVQDLYPQTVVDLGLLRNRAAIRAAEGLEAAAYRLAGRIVVHSPGNREFLIQRKGVPPGKLRVIYNWVDLDRLRPGAKENVFRTFKSLLAETIVFHRLSATPSPTSKKMISGPPCNNPAASITGVRSCAYTISPANDTTNRPSRPFCCRNTFSFAPGLSRSRSTQL